LIGSGCVVDSEVHTLAEVGRLWSAFWVWRANGFDNRVYSVVDRHIERVDLSAREVASDVRQPDVSLTNGSEFKGPGVAVELIVIEATSEIRRHGGCLELS